MAALALSMSTRTDEAAAGRGAPRRLPPEGQRAVALEVPSGGLLHLRVRGDPHDAARRRRSRRARGDGARGDRSGSRGGGAAGGAARGLLAAARRAARRQRRGAGAAQGPAAPDRRGGARRAEGAGRAVHHRRRRRAAAGARTTDQGPSSGEARLPGGLPPRRAVGAQGVRHLRDELGDRGARHVAARRDGVRQSRSSPPPRAGFRKRSWIGETGLLVPPRDHEAMASAIVALLTDERARRAMGERRAQARRASASASSGWCGTRFASTSRRSPRKAASRAPRIEDRPPPPARRRPPRATAWPRRSRRAAAKAGGPKPFAEAMDLERHKPGRQPEWSRGAVVEGDGRAVAGERHAARDARSTASHRARPG